MKILCIAGSPRPRGNTALLLDAFIDEARGAGHEVEVLTLANPSISPCLGCDKCLAGKCVQDDRMQDIYTRLDAAGAIALAAPVYFYGLPAQVKAMVDRCQLFYNRKYRLATPRTDKRPGLFISCGASAGPRLFDGAALTVKYWFDSMDVEYVGDALIRGVDETGAVGNRPDSLRDARSLVRKLPRPK